MLGGREAYERDNWWKQVAPTSAWAERYSAGSDEIAFTDVRRLISESIADTQRQQRNRTRLVGGTMIFLALATVVSGLFYRDATIAKDKAIALGIKAESARKVADGALSNVYRSRAKQVNKLVEEGDAVTAALLAVESLPDKNSKSALVQGRPFVSNVKLALEKALRAQTERQILHGHEGKVHSAAFSSDGKFILTASDDKTARLWEVDRVDHVMIFKGHEKGVWTAVFSPDGKRVLTASGDGTARLWDIKTGKELMNLRGHKGQVFDAQFSRDGTHILTAGEDKLAKLWNAETGKEVRTYKGHEEAVYSAVFSPDGKRVLTGGADNTARIWEKDTGNQLFVLKGHTREIYPAAFSPDGSRVLTASYDKTARLWDAKTGAELKKFTVKDKAVTSAVFAPDGKHVLTASEDGTAQLWNVKTGKQVRVYKGHEGVVISVAFSPDGRTIITASEDRTVRLWDLEPGGVFEGHEDWVKSVAMSRDGRHVLTTSDDDTARIWNAKTFKQITVLKGHTSDVMSGVFSADGALVLTASIDNTARLWKTQSGKPHGFLVRHKKSVYSAVFSPDEKHVLTASSDKTAKIWDIKSGKSLHTFKHNSKVSHAVYSHDGKTVLTGLDNGAVNLWNIASGKLVRSFKGHDNRVYHAVFSADDKTALTASYDNTVILWEVETGKILRTLESNSGFTSAVFSPDGSSILTASEDDTARLWDIKTGKELSRLDLHEGDINHATFSPDGRHVLTASEDNTARISRMFPKTQDLVTFAKSSLLRCLGPKQRRGFFLARELPLFCQSDKIWPHNSPLFQLSEGEGLLTDNKDDKAGAHFDIALRQNGDLSSRIANLYTARGRKRLLDDKDEAAKKDFAQATRRDQKRSKEHTKYLAKSYIDRAAKHIKMEQDAKAEIDFAQAVELIPVPVVKKNTNDGPDVKTRSGPASVKKPVKDKKVEYAALIASAYVDRAIAQLAKDEDIKAGTSFGKALENHRSGAPGYKVKFANALADRVKTHIKNEDDDRAKSDYASALRHNPSGKAEYAKLLATAYAERGGKHLLAEQDDKAVADFDAAMKLDEKGQAKQAALIAKTYVNRARTRIETNKDEAARKDLKEALQRNPAGKSEHQKNYAEALVTRGHNHLGEDADGKAEADFKAAIQVSTEVHKPIAKAYRQRGWFYRNKWRYKKALHYFEQARHHDPQDNDALIGQSAARYGLTELDAALANIDKAIEREPKNSLAHSWRGSISLGRGSFSTAQQDFTRAIEHDKDNSIGYIERAMTYRLQLNFRDARADEVKARKLGKPAAVVDVYSRFGGAIQKMYDANRHTQASIIGLANLFELSKDKLSDADLRTVMGSFVAFGYSISENFIERTHTSLKLDKVTRCDEFAALIYDPLRRVTRGMPFDKIPVDIALAACEDAVKKYGPQPHLLLQQARVFSKIARDTKNMSLAKEYYGKTFEFLNKAMKKNYPMAFNNTGYYFYNGEGVEKSREKGRAFYLQTINRVVQCCGAPAAEQLLDAKTDYHRSIILRSVHALLTWGAALGDPAAHQTLAALYAKGTLSPAGLTGSINPHVYRHLLLSERLYFERAKTSIPRPVWESPKTDLANSVALSPRIKTLGSDLSEAEKNTIKAEVKAFTANAFDSLPPWMTPAPPKQADTDAKSIKTR